MEGVLPLTVEHWHIDLEYTEQIVSFIFESGSGAICSLCHALGQRVVRKGGISFQESMTDVSDFLQLSAMGGLCPQPFPFTVEEDEFLG